MRIRELAPAELDFLREMLYTALAWRPDVELPPREWVLAHDEVVIYHRDWGRPGDAALVAETDGRLVGAVWCRLFTEDEHGDGYVDDATPELSIAVAESHRGRGIGTQLIAAMHERARREGLTRLALSVDQDNPAKRLYERVGYVGFEPGDGKGRMLYELSVPAYGS
ncbi:MAG: N-acetyltransferase family protein [Gaiellaceae bacterium]